LRGAGMPAVLIETGFLTDKKEARLLASSRYQDKLGASIARGISSYLAQIR
jgi:N-acetylmuramoyl-L-alanine amidase